MGQHGPIIDGGTGLSGGVDSILAMMDPAFVQSLSPQALEQLKKLFVNFLPKDPKYAGLFHPPGPSWDPTNAFVEMFRQDLGKGNVGFQQGTPQHEGMHGLDPKFSGVLSPLFTPGGGAGFASGDPAYIKEINDLYGANDDISRHAEELFATIGATGAANIPEEFQGAYADIFQEGAFEPLPPSPTLAKTLKTEPGSSQLPDVDFQRYQTEQERRRAPRLPRIPTRSNKVRIK